MGHLPPMLDLLLIDDDDMLIADANAVSHTSIRIAIARDVVSARRLAADWHFDAVALNVALDGGLDLIATLVGDSLGAPVIAIAAHGLAGRTLENTLTIAELRGAALSLPKPIDAIELVAAAVAQAARSAKAAA